MIQIFERFTDRSRRVVVLAMEEARLGGATHIGDEHLFLGLLGEGEGVAAKALANVGIGDIAAARDVVAIISGVDRRSPSPQGHLPFTPRCKKVLELGLREALQLGHNYIGTEHLLLALIREGEGVGCRALIAMSSVQEDALSTARHAVINLLAGYLPRSTSPPPEPAPPAPPDVVLALDPAFAGEIVAILDGLHHAIFRGTWDSHPLATLQVGIVNGLARAASREED